MLERRKVAGDCADLGLEGGEASANKGLRNRATNGLGLMIAAAALDKRCGASMAGGITAMQGIV